MTCLPYVAIAAAFALIHLPRLVVSREMKHQPGGYDNHEPRRQQAQLEGIGRRALGAHQNGFEAFAPFAIGVIAALSRGVRPGVVDAIAFGFVAVRTGYVIAYLADKPTLRSALWALGMIATVALYVYAILGG
ncbi:MAG TPA: MAPEG family protein [Kofleriaceae bacterium]|nr:MAPEG family protein [Kofleriaceae bacterium]